MTGIRVSQNEKDLSRFLYRTSLALLFVVSEGNMRLCWMCDSFEILKKYKNHWFQLRYRYIWSDSFEHSRSVSQGNENTTSANKTRKTDSPTNQNVSSESISNSGENTQSQQNNFSQAAGVDDGIEQKKKNSFGGISVVFSRFDGNFVGNGLIVK